MSTQADHCILSGVQTYVTLESAVLVATVGRSRAAGSGTWVFSGRSGTRGWRGGSSGHLKTQQEGTGEDGSAGTQRFNIST